ncbi:MAG: hypothetical protein QNJ62_04500 [Methyloceanibacter sp.]|nr:hypothetical protein [Methyloceanibacter sp.]
MKRSRSDTKPEEEPAVDSSVTGGSEDYTHSSSADVVEQRSVAESETSSLTAQLQRAAGELALKAAQRDKKEEKGLSAMDNGAKAIEHPAATRSLREAVRKARLVEAERLDQDADHRDGELARLDLLRSELETVFADIPSNDDRFNLALVPSRPARLWIDMFTYVTLDEGTNAYLFVRNSENGRRTLFRATNVAEMADRITDYVAGQIVQRERMEAALVLPGISSQQAPMEPNPHLNTRMVIMGFIVGLLTGAVGLFAAVWLSAA